MLWLLALVHVLLSIQFSFVDDREVADVDADADADAVAAAAFLQY